MKNNVFGLSLMFFGFLCFLSSILFIMGVLPFQAVIDSWFDNWVKTTPFTHCHDFAEVTISDGVGGSISSGGSICSSVSSSILSVFFMFVGGVFLIFGLVVNDMSGNGKGF